MMPDERAVYEEQDYKRKAQPSLIACGTISGSFMATVQPENVQCICVSSQETMLRQDADDTLKVDSEKSKTLPGPPSELPLDQSDGAKLFS
ncbi:hypothetical protein ACRRTK_015402 [Alexandromys fortis]